MHDTAIINIAAHTLHAAPSKISAANDNPHEVPEWRKLPQYNDPSDQGFRKSWSNTFYTDLALAMKSEAETFGLRPTGDERALRALAGDADKTNHKICQEIVLLAKYIKQLLDQQRNIEASDVIDLNARRTTEQSTQLVGAKTPETLINDARTALQSRLSSLSKQVQPKGYGTHP